MKSPILIMCFLKWHFLWLHVIFKRYILGFYGGRETMCTVKYLLHFLKFLVLFYYNGERSFPCSPLVSCREQQFLFVPSTKTCYRLRTGKQYRFMMVTKEDKDQEWYFWSLQSIPYSQVIILNVFQMGFRLLSIQFYRDHQ